MTGVSLLILVALLLGNAFFVAAEFALVSTRADQIEPRADGRVGRARSRRWRRCATSAR